MANRYWVGGTGNWDATTTNWSALSGGAGGASVPTLADDVFFDTLSNATAYVVTLTTAPVCRSVSVAGPATGNVTLAGSVGWSIYGSLTITATGVTNTYNGNMFFVATTTGWTVTTNGVTLGSIVQFSGVGGGWTLGSALTAGNGLQFRNGTLTTNNFSITTTNNIDLTGANARTLNLGTSTISAGVWTALGATNLTINAGTSTITVTGAAGTFNGGGQTYYNVTRASNGFAIGDGGNTFNALTNTTTSSGGAFPCSFAGNQTVGTLTINGGVNQASRASVQTPSTLAGTQVTLTVASFVTNGNIDFRDINFAGAASPLTVATGGDCGNNTNITFQAPRNIYWSLLAGGNWGNVSAWAVTSGGVPSGADYPLPQDTVIIDNAGLTSGNTITLNISPNVGPINMSLRTSPMTFAVGGFVPIIYGDLTLSSAVTTTATTGSFTFSGYNKTQTITSAGTTIPFQIVVIGRLTTLALSGALTMSSTAAFTLTLGTLNLANNNLTCGLFSSSNSNTRSITFGTGQINLTGSATTILFLQDLSNFTYTGTLAFYSNYSGSTGTRTFAIGSTGSSEATVPDVYVTAGTDTISFVVNAYLGTLNTAGFTGTITPATSGLRIWRNLVIGSGATWSGATSTVYFLATAVSQSITTNSVALNSILAFIGTQTYTLQDAITTSALVSHTLGTLNLNAKTLTAGTFSSTGASVRSITFNGGTMAVSGATFTASGSNFTTSGSGTVSMTSASSKTFAGGGFSYPTLNQGGAGALVITGANTFANMTNTVQPCTITFPASTITRVSDFNVNGTTGNLVTLNSSTPGTRFTLAKL